MPPVEAETTGPGSGATGFAPPPLFGCGALLVVFLELLAPEALEPV